MISRRARWWMYPVLIIWTVIVLFPIWWMVVTSFKSDIAIASGPTYFPGIDFSPTLRAWREIFLGADSSQTIWLPLENSLVIGLSSTLLALVAGSLAAYGLTRYQVRLGPMRNNDIMFWFISQRMMPPIVTALAFFIILKHLDLLDTRLGLILVYTGFNLPLTVWFMNSFIRQVPISLEEAAFIDGASRLQTIARVVLPLAVPGLIATFLIVFSLAWNEFLFAVILTQNHAFTLPVLIQAQQTERGTAWWGVCAIGLVSITPMIILALFLQRRLVTAILGGHER
jgi:multiple sugar transport system permease protein